MKRSIPSIIIVCFAISILFSQTLFAQEAEESDSLFFKFDQDSLQLDIGDTVRLKIDLINEAGELQTNPFFVFSRGKNARRSVTVTPRRSDSTGTLIANIIAHKPGFFRIAARSISPGNRVRSEIPVKVNFPPLAKVEFQNPKEKIYARTTTSFKTKVIDAAGFDRKNVQVSLTSSHPKIASLDGYGNLTAHKSGKITLTAQTGNIVESLEIQIVKNPVTRVELNSDMEEGRTGDVFHFSAMAFDKKGKDVSDAPIRYYVNANPEDNLGPSATGQIEQDGRFVAETPGLYTIAAQSGPFIDQLTVRITKRNVRKKLELVGHGAVEDVYTSDLWVWEGVDGRDYAITGTWGANGEAYFWDVTDPANMTIIDTITVDARTINDVKVSEDGRIAVISREGASNRRNGILILDVTNPHDVKILSRYDDELTGGVHNVFIYKEHVYAVNNGRRFDVINIEDPTNPHRVGRFELNTPGHSIHDVWIEDGIAYSSNWGDGIQLIDVGSGTGGQFQKYVETPMPEVKSPFYAGGSPQNPKNFGSYEYPSGWNHAAFPFHSESTGKFYVLAGDEAFPYGDGADQFKPTIAAGWIHFIDFTNPASPKETARYEVPEAGSHNLWVEDDILYAAFYNGGLRVVDISGELMGDLYKQGREIAWYLPYHPKGLIPNSPMVWGPQPYKGLIFFSDFDSGLWAVKLVDEE